MNQDFIAKQKKILQDQLNELESRLNGLTVKTEHGDEVKFPNWGDGADDNAAEVAQYQDSLSLTNTLEEEIDDVKKALQRIESGSYGICKYCQQEISEERLTIRPTSSSCVACKKKLVGES